MLVLKANETTLDCRSRVAYIVQYDIFVFTSAKATSLDMTTISTIPNHWGTDISVTRVSTMFSTRVKIKAVALAQQCSPEQTRLSVGV